MTQNNQQLAVERVISRHEQRRSIIRQTLTEPCFRYPVLSVLVLASTYANEGPFQLSDARLLAASLQIMGDTNSLDLVCFDLQGFSFTASLIGLPLRRKPFNWSDWNNGGTVSEPDCPFVICVNPFDGTTSMAFVYQDDSGDFDTAYATEMIARCVGKWLRFIDHLDNADVAAAKRPPRSKSRT